VKGENVSQPTKLRVRRWIVDERRKLILLVLDDARRRISYMIRSEFDPLWILDGHPDYMTGGYVYVVFEDGWLRWVAPDNYFECLEDGFPGRKNW
jgi:hypothetical protein